MKRLQRLAIQLPESQRPRFFEGIVPMSRLPTSFGIDMPVLRVVFPDRVFFDTDRSTPRLEAYEIADLVADSLRKDVPDVAMFIAGHADSRGDRSHNEALSIDRADSLAADILRKGISFASIWRVGFGEDMPVVVGNDAYAWDRNRRVEFLFAGKAEAVGVWLEDQQIQNLCQSRNAAESASCKQRLNIDRVYEARELVLRAPKPTVVKPDNPRTSRSVKIDSNDRSNDVAIVGPTKVEMKPEIGRIIRITPALPQRKPVSVRL